MPLKEIVVTQAHIDRAKALVGSGKSASHCPLAIALAELYPGAKALALPSRTEVFTDHWSSGHALLTFHGTKATRAFMHRWDSRGEADPATFLVEPVPPIDCRLT
jgi:hypothetical protein